MCTVVRPVYVCKEKKFVYQTRIFTLSNVIKIVCLNILKVNFIIVNFYYRFALV